jgi:DNA invertase Pin-like site-specific DNA recombinase
MARNSRGVMVLAYARVSSKAQSLAMQRAAILRELRSRGLDVWNWYEDTASARTLDRPALSELRRFVKMRSGPAPGRMPIVVIVYRLDRLARSGIRDTLEVIEEFRAAGATLVSCSDGFDLSGPAAEIVIAVMSWAAKMERLAINERISSARLRIERDGGAWGRPRRMTPAQVLQFRIMRKVGRSLRACAIALKVPRSTLARAEA